MTDVVVTYMARCVRQVADDLPSNLYKVKFFGNTGYILGSNGVLLKGISS